MIQQEEDIDCVRQLQRKFDPSIEFFPPCSTAELLMLNYCHYAPVMQTGERKPFSAGSTRKGVEASAKLRIQEADERAAACFDGMKKMLEAGASNVEIALALEIGEWSVPRYIDKSPILKELADRRKAGSYGAKKRVLEKKDELKAALESNEPMARICRKFHIGPLTIRKYEAEIRA